MICLETVQKFCKEYTKIENYEKAITDTTQTWHCHHRAEIIYSRNELIEKGMYYNLFPCDLIFLTAKEHRQLHSKGLKMSDEAKAKISAANKGKMRTEEQKKKISEATKIAMKNKGTGEKISAAFKGRHWRIVNGKRIWQ